MQKIWTVCISICLAVNVFAQHDTASPSFFKSTIDSYLQINKPDIIPILNFPIITINQGVMTYKGDISHKNSQNINIGMPATFISLSQLLSPEFSIDLFFLKGEIRGEFTPLLSSQSYNFKTDIHSFGTTLHYNFGHIASFSQKREKTISPYIGIGVEILQRALPKGNVFTDTIAYNQWSDGTIRNIPESRYTTSKSEILYNNYTYETDYDFSGYSHKDFYNPITIAFPIDYGVQFRLTHKFSIRIGQQLHISSSNYIDNVSSAPMAKSQTSVKKRPDMFTYNYIGASLHISSKQKQLWDDNSNVLHVYDFWDEDNDGIDETLDECPYTPAKAEVYANGCPVDSDNDGVPDYRDKELHSKAFCVDVDGVGMSEREFLTQINATHIVAQKDIYRYYSKLLNGGTVYKQFYKKIPWKFKNLDTDKNEYIDLDEMLMAIDTFFDEGPNAGVGAQLNVKDLFELIEFFFLQ